MRCSQFILYTYFTWDSAEEGVSITLWSCFPLPPDNLLRTLPTEVLENDTEDLHEISGVSHSAERSSGSESRTAEPTSLDKSTLFRLHEQCQCSLGKNTFWISYCQGACPATPEIAVGVFGNWKPWRATQRLRECCLTAESLAEVFSILQWNKAIFFSGPTDYYV